MLCDLATDNQITWPGRLTVFSIRRCNRLTAQMKAANTLVYFRGARRFNMSTCLLACYMERQSEEAKEKILPRRRALLALWKWRCSSWLRRWFQWRAIEGPGRVPVGRREWANRRCGGCDQTSSPQRSTPLVPSHAINQKHNEWPGTPFHHSIPAGGFGAFTRAPLSRTQLPVNAHVVGAGSASAWVIKVSSIHQAQCKEWRIRPSKLKGSKYSCSSCFTKSPLALSENRLGAPLNSWCSGLFQLQIYPTLGRSHKGMKVISHTPTKIKLRYANVFPFCEKRTPKYRRGKVIRYSSS